MKSKFIILSLFTLFISHSKNFSQSNKIVKLKNGSELRGKILANSENDLKLKTKDGNIWVFQHNEIDTIFTYKTPFIQSHFYNRTTIGMLLGNPEGFSAQIVNGYSFKNGLNIGIGLGTENYQYNNKYRSIFGDIQYNVLKKRSAPFINLTGGFCMPDDLRFIRKGFMLGISIGLNHYFSQHVGITTSIGYRFSQLRLRDFYGYYNLKNGLNVHQCHQLEIRFGLIFK